MLSRLSEGVGPGRHGTGCAFAREGAGPGCRYVGWREVGGAKVWCGVELLRGAVAAGRW